MAATSPRSPNAAKPTASDAAVPDPRRALERIAPDPAATRALGAALGGCLRPGALVTLSGELGAGKTTLAQGIARGLGVAGRVTSPTYTLLRGYALGSGRAAGADEAPGASAGRAPREPAAAQLVHADLYRLRSEGEVRELGLDECRAAGDIVVVEWPEQDGGALGPADIAVALRAADRAGRDALDVGDRDAASDQNAARRIAILARTPLGESILACVAAAVAAAGVAAGEPAGDAP